MRLCERRNCQKFVLLGITVVLFGLPAVAFSLHPIQQSPAAAPVSIDEVIQLHKAGIGENILITRIKQANKPLQLSTEELLKLSQAKVPERVIQVLMDTTLNVAPPTAAVAPGQPAAPTVIVTGDGGIPIVGGVSNASRPSGATTDERTAAGDPNDPNAPHDSGIYLYFINKLKQPEMILLEPAAYTGQKSGGRFLSSVTYGIAKTNQKAILQGGKANIRAVDRRPVFYFYFEDKSAALGKGGFLTGSPITSPNQFVLLKLDAKKSTRETIVLEEGVFGGSSGTNQKSIATFKSERIRPGLYKVTPDKDLEPGEYCFLAGLAIGGAATAGAALPFQIFDFGVPIEF